MSKVIVIGGGAAGMMAAIAAAQKGHKVILLEKNEKLGKKLFITGKGRCNVTNAADMDVLFQNICTNEKFLYSAFYGFDNTRVCDLLEQAGCPLKTERGDRVFPVSDHSSDVIAALQRELRKYQVDVHLHTEVIKILTKETDGNPVFCGVECADHKKIAADDCIVCTGGCSYASTGSTGDGYRFAEETGHKVTERKPALVPLEIRENWCREQVVQRIFKLFVLCFLKIPKQTFVQLFRGQRRFQIQEKFYLIAAFTFRKIFRIKAAG